MDTLTKILYLLKKNGLSEAEFARKLKMSRSNVTDWKRGRTKSYNKKLDKIAEILNVSVNDLLSDSDDSVYNSNMPPTTSNIAPLNSNTTNTLSKKISYKEHNCIQMILNDDEQKLIDNYRGLDDEGKVNVKHTMYYELRRIKQEGDRGTNKIFRANN